MNLQDMLADGAIEGFDSERKGDRYVVTVSKGSKTGSGSGATEAEAAEAAVDDMKGGSKSSEKSKE